MAPISLSTTSQDTSSLTAAEFEMPAAGAAGCIRQNVLMRRYSLTSGLGPGGPTAAEIGGGSWGWRALPFVCPGTSSAQGLTQVAARPLRAAGFSGAQLQGRSPAQPWPAPIRTRFPLSAAPWSSNARSASSRCICSMRQAGCCGCCSLIEKGTWAPGRTACPARRPWSWLPISRWCSVLKPGCRCCEALARRNFCRAFFIGGVDCDRVNQLS